MNENDSERIAGMLQNFNIHPASSLEDSSIAIINTCAVRHKSEEKLFSLLGRLESLKKKNNMKVGVVGCVAQLYRNELLKTKPMIDFVIGPDNYQDIPGLLVGMDREKFISTAWHRDWEDRSRSHVVHKSPFSAYVTIMEGCNHFCSYCIVPFTRGREKFRPKKFILEEIIKLASNGFKEIILLGQNVNSYRDPETGTGFAELLNELNCIEGFDWLRFITSHPINLTPGIADAMKDNKKVCPSLHLPVQSGATSVLNRMKRGYSREEYLEMIALLRQRMPDISLSTDIIVGYPGETEEEYKNTLSLLKEVRYSNIFSFHYSSRPRTSASREKDSVSPEIKRRRLIDLQELQKTIQIENHMSYLGKIVKTLCLGRSKKDNSQYTGRNAGYEVVNFSSPVPCEGRFVDVEITGCGPYSLHGKAIFPKSG